MDFRLFPLAFGGFSIISRHIYKPIKHKRNENKQTLPRGTPNRKRPRQLGKQPHPPYNVPSDPLVSILFLPQTYTLNEMKKAKNINPIKTDALKSRIQEMTQERDRLISTGEVNDLHICISEGNVKLGNIISISLIPVADCGNCSACHRLCYDIRTDCMRQNVRSSRAKNSAILRHDPARFWNEWRGAVGYYITFRGTVACRYNVGGDILDNDYFEEMVKTAQQYPNVDFLAFTKQFAIVNSWLDRNGGELPKNLQIVFSAWVGLEVPNPYNLPTSNPVFSEVTKKKMGYSESTTAKPGAYYCTGNCTDCKAGCNKHNSNEIWNGCWNLKKGEAVVFFAH